MAPSNNPLGPRLLTVADVAEHLNVPATRARKLIRRRELASINIGSPRRPEWRVRPSDIEKYLQARRNT